MTHQPRHNRCSTTDTNASGAFVFVVVVVVVVVVCFFAKKENQKVCGGRFWMWRGGTRQAAVAAT
jgi:hypothetical protein